MYFTDHFLCFRDSANSVLIRWSVQWKVIFDLFIVIPFLFLFTHLEIMGQILGSPHWLESSVLKDWSSPILFREVKNVSNQLLKNLINRNYFPFLFSRILERIYHYWMLCNYWRWLSYPDTQLLTPLRVSLSEYLMKWDLEMKQSFALCHFVKILIIIPLAVFFDCERKRNMLATWEHSGEARKTKEKKKKKTGNVFLGSLSYT